MFGTNPTRPQELSDGSALYVEDIFYTIQGEGPYAGSPAVFIRLSGCHLKCFFCDTQFETGMDKTVELAAILRRVYASYAGNTAGKTSVAPIVVLTGGEPMRQNITPLIHKLLETHPHVQIETAGSFWVAGLLDLILQGRLTIVCSPKTPKVHKMIEAHCHNWKYIIWEGGISTFDGLPLMSTQVKGKEQPVYRAGPIGNTIWVQPCDEPDLTINKTARNIKLAAAVAMRYGYKLCLQLHKTLGLP